MNYRILLRILLLTLLAYWSGSDNLLAQDTTNSISVEDTISLDVALFDEDEPAVISLTYNVKEFLRNKNKDKYVKAKLVYQINDTITISKEIRIKARGHNRRDVCPFPPLWINIRKANFNSSYFERTKKLKLVTYCARSQSNMNYVLKEFLVYRMYNIINPNSFKVRLVKVKYIDTGRKNKEYDSWGFFIEPEEMMAQRLNASVIKRDNISYQITDPRETDIMSVFQYIIGNADYSILSRQNVKLIMLNDSPKNSIVPVPYDFDYSGFVDAAYAIPGGRLGIESVKERYFLGPCRPDDTYFEVFDYFFEKREEIYHFLRSFEHLDKRSKNAALKYLDEVYLSTINKGYIKNNLRRTCRETDLVKK